MTPDEKDLLARFLQQLTAAQAGQKDEEAERLIREACARQPDAAYLLVQRAMQLDQAFQASQAQATKLQLELDRTRVDSSSGFLNDPHAWGSRATQTPAPGAVAQPPATAAAAAAPARAAPSPWGSSMLGTVATTAAGVVAGSFLFQGIQGLMHKNEPPAAKPEHTAQGPVSDEHAIGTNEETDTYAEAPDDSGGDFA